MSHFVAGATSLINPRARYTYGFGASRPRPTGAELRQYEHWMIADDAAPVAASGGDHGNAFVASTLLPDSVSIC